MDGRCLECGFEEADYTARGDRSWLARAVPERASLVFEHLRQESTVGGFGDANSLRDHLVQLLAREQLHEAVHLCQLSSREAAALVYGPEFSLEGKVASLQVSQGGVPKLPVPFAEVGFRGVAGDGRRSRRHHGHAWQALCLWSAEVIEALLQEGHPIGPGKAGENITLQGLDWGGLRSGLLLEIGEVVCELTGPASPCKENKAWFADGDFNRIDHGRHPGWSRWYAAVLRPGRVLPGDPVRARLAALSD